MLSWAYLLFIVANLCYTRYCRYWLNLSNFDGRLNPEQNRRPTSVFFLKLLKKLLDLNPSLLSWSTIRQYRISTVTDGDSIFFHKTVFIYWKFLFAIRINEQRPRIIKANNFHGVISGRSIEHWRFCLPSALCEHHYVHNIQGVL